MPRAKSICLERGCTSVTFRDGRCKGHQIRKPWQNASARNLSRPSNWSGIRAKVLARDRFTCQVCGSRSDLEVDHVVPVAKGGSWESENLWVLCRQHHSEKSKWDKRGKD